jgi:hypothetical protein
MGEWNLAMLFIDELPEQYEDDSSCIQGNFKKINSTTFKQMWYITFTIWIWSYYGPSHYNYTFRRLDSH